MQGWIWRSNSTSTTSPHLLALSECSRRRLAVDIAALGAHATDLQLAKLCERSNVLRRRIKAWIKVQQLYAPETAFLRKADERSAAPHSPETVAEAIQLYLPSQVPLTMKGNPALPEFEWQLQHAQANDALNELCNHLRLQSQLWKHKTRFDVGQRPNTRSCNVIERCNAKISLDVKKYNSARAALVLLARRLNKVGWDQTMQVLRSHDVRGLESDADDGKAQGKKRQLNEGRRARSWIWETPGMTTNGNGGLHEGMILLVTIESLY